MPHFTRFFVWGCFFFALTALALESVVFPTGGGILHLSAAISNDNIVISWPVSPGHWQLMEQKPAFEGPWKPVIGASFQTNALLVSTTLPIPDKTTLYRLTRSFNFHSGDMPNLPPVPAPPTNRPAPPKLPAH